MSKRRRAVDPIAEYIARANRPSAKGIGSPPPELGIEPSAHPVYLRRDMVVFLLIGFTCLPLTLFLTWAATRQPILDATILAPIMFGIITVIALYAGISNWRNLHRR
ncbi:hypothetical protein GPROT1_01639 [Gammaproteobacteria bacterium]|nr:hypothetical protein GPROT1_01639 [Gammaproteobacteria bacterium]